jgi:uncharacterized membrane protein
MPNRFELEIDRRLTEVAEQFRVGQVSAVAASKITVVTSGGATLTVPRLSHWTPVATDIVLLAATPLGWIAIGKILP